MGGMKRPEISLIWLAAAVVGMWVISACASIGTPSGGWRDEKPPVFVRSNPAPGATEVKTRRVVIEFDENINVKDAFQKVVVSPTGSETPRVSSNGRRVNVEFRDTLKPNTTYTIDFANAIEDNNEGNKLQGFAYTFSTGTEIDSLRISGMVLNASNLEPQQGMLVGVHENMSDTAFTRVPMVRVAKTDDRGRFTIRGLKEGPYRLFALKDLNNDFKWDNPEEDIAFHDELIYPASEPSVTHDTIYKEMMSEPDTVIERAYTQFLPNDILLNSFNINYKPQYLVKNERLDSARLRLIFNAPSVTMPRVEVVGAPSMTNWYVAERSVGNDTIVYWLTSKALIASDTLRLSTSYMRSNPDKLLETATDTLRFITPKVKAKKKKKKREDADTLPPPVRLLKAEFLSRSELDVFAPLLIEFERPLKRLDTAAFHLEQMIDSVWRPLKTRILPLDTLGSHRYKFDHKWDYGGTYRLRADTLAAEGIYGLHTGPLKHEFKVKREEDYSNLFFRIEGLDSLPAFMELLTKADVPVRMATVEQGLASFLNVTPGSYYVRLVIDANGNGKFDTGDYENRIQPEMTFYYSKRINLKKNWDLDMTWNIYDTPVDLQKPEEIKKNKPARTKDRQETNTGEGDEDDYFDPTENPFNPNQKKRRDEKNRNSNGAF